MTATPGNEDVLLLMLGRAEKASNSARIQLMTASTWLGRERAVEISRARLSLMSALHQVDKALELITSKEVANG